MQVIDQAVRFPMQPHNRINVFRKAAMAIITGVGGNLVLTMFLMTFLNVGPAIKFIPWILAFNSAATGYGIIIKTQNRSPRWKIWTATAGLITAAITVGIIALYGGYRFGEAIFSFQDLIGFGIVGMIAGLLGGLLAVKYIKMNRP